MSSQQWFKTEIGPHKDCSKAHTHTRTQNLITVHGN